MLSLLQTLFGFLATLLGVAGNTWDETKTPFIKKITNRGWAAIVLAAATLAVTLIKEAQLRDEAKTANETINRLVEQSSKLIPLLENLLSGPASPTQKAEATAVYQQQLKDIESVSVPVVSQSIGSVPLANKPSWLRLAQQQVGVSESPSGTAPNPQIIKYLQSIRLTNPSQDIPWASAFVNWVITQSGVKGTNSGLARSWLRWGVSVEAQPGCIVIFPRPGNSLAGHVGFVVEVRDNQLVVVSGNVGNSVTYRLYDRASALGCRLP